MFAFTQEDCLPYDAASSLMVKVLALDPDVTDKCDIGQLFFCVNESTLGDMELPYLPAWSLLTGELEYLDKRNVLGILYPDRLPMDAALQLSQIRPPEAEVDPDPPSVYTGYCYHPDGRVASGVTLPGWQQAMQYARMQAPYQYAVRVFDEEGMSVLEMLCGEITFIEPP